MFKRIRIKHFAHLCMLAFAGASLFNLKAYILSVDGNPALAWSLAVALSGVLVILAGFLSELQWNPNDTKFRTILAVTTGLTIVSGSIQGASYASHSWWLPGYALGFALPGLGELGLALAISAYTRSLDGREVAEAQRQLSIGVRRHLVEAIANVDKSRIEAQVNRAMTTVTRELVDSVVADMVGELRGNRTVQMITQLDTPIEQPVSNIEQVQDVQNAKLNDLSKEWTGLERANEQRKADKQKAMRIMLDAYKENPYASLRDVGGIVGRSPGTINNWLKDLEEQKIIHKNGNGVEIL